MTLIETVARAICVSAGRNPDKMMTGTALETIQCPHVGRKSVLIDLQPWPQWQEFTRQANAAIASVNEALR